MAKSAAMAHLRVISVLCLAALSAAADSSKPHYVGSETCALCHKDIAASEEKTAMAKTWSGHFPATLPAGFDAQISSDGWGYRIFKERGVLTYSLQAPGAAKLAFPVEAAMGGERHGLGFLVKFDHIADIPLARPALVQARYFWSFKQSTLALAPGLPDNPAHSLETGLGLVLSPAFEKQCLTCHGEPGTPGAGKQGGVRCESCHGPGSQHLMAVGKGRPAEGIISPRKLSANESIGICAQCHAGFGRHLDPAPADLLIANQVHALRTSECFIQSGASFSCTACHNPHEDARGNEATAIRACLGCHSENLSSRRAAVCAVNASSGCIGCHMPAVNIGPLRLVDHQIRVHPEQGVAVPIHDRALRSQVAPIREFLRVIRSEQYAKILEAERRLQSGQSFYDVARALSDDPTASIGGYWGEKEVKTLATALTAAVAKLAYGEVSGIVQAGRDYYLVQRLPRDFKWQAARLQDEAEALQSIEKSQEALRIYPHFLRALRFIGTMLAERGNLQRAEEVLSLTNRLYPEDAVSLFSLGIVFGQLHRPGDEIDAYRRALDLEPDFLAVYARLAIALDAARDSAGAIAVLRRGLKIDPLSADLYHELSVSLARQGDAAQAKQCAALAARLDPRYSN